LADVTDSSKVKRADVPQFADSHIARYGRGVGELVRPAARGKPFAPNRTILEDF